MEEIPSAAAQVVRSRQAGEHTDMERERCGAYPLIGRMVCLQSDSDSLALMQPETKEDQARAAYAQIEKPVTEARALSFGLRKNLGLLSVHRSKAPGCQYSGWTDFGLALQYDRLSLRASPSSSPPRFNKGVPLSASPPRLLILDFEKASFVKWYCASHNKKPAGKRPAEAAAAAPPAKAAKAATQALLPGAAAPAAAPMAASKAKALLKGIVTSVKAAAKAKRWHHGDSADLTGTAVMDPADFAALFRAHPSVALTASSGVVTTLSLTAVQLTDIFGSAIENLKVGTWSHPRSFQKSYKTGDAVLSFSSAEGKYSKGTSTLTLKFRTVAGGGGGGGDGMFDDDDYNM